MSTGFKKILLSYLVDKSLVNGSGLILGNTSLLHYLKDNDFTVTEKSERQERFDFVYLSYKYRDIFYILNGLNKLSSGGTLFCNIGKHDKELIEKFTRLISDRIYPSGLQYTTANGINCTILVLRKGSL